MTDNPKWHGWATAEQVRQMMEEMYNFLEFNNEKIPLKDKIKEDYQFELNLNPWCDSDANL